MNEARLRRRTLWGRADATRLARSRAKVCRSLVAGASVWLAGACQSAEPADAARDAASAERLDAASADRLDAASADRLDAASHASRRDDAGMQDLDASASPSKDAAATTDAEAAPPLVDAASGEELGQ